MIKFLAVVRREYFKRVRTKSFIALTILGPLLMIGFILLPVLIAFLGANESVRIGVVDQSDRIYKRLNDSLSRGPENSGSAPSGSQLDLTQNPQQRARSVGDSLPGSFKLEPVAVAGRSLEEVKRELNARVLNDELNGYLIIPADILTARNAEFYGRNVNDLFTRGQLAEKLSRAVIEQRFADEGVEQKLLDEMSQQVNLDAIKVSEKGEERDSGAAFFFVLGVGFVIFIMVLMYGGVILSAIVEEKETRVAEMLFSSMRAFPLLLGKLMGVSLVALTQFVIWGVLIGAFLFFGASTLASNGIEIAIPAIGASAIVYFFFFFFMGYFLYASMFALIGSIVTSQDESQQFIMPAVFPLIIGFYLVFPVIRSPDSSLAIWASLFPLTSPVVMLVRIVSQVPPFWQIALSLVLGFATFVLVIWIAARIYRVGMLMYGKRATIPEIARWARSSGR